MAAKPKTINEYLAQVDANKRATLERIRKIIHAGAPGVEEYIGYGLAAFRLHGKPLMGMGVGANHYALYPMNSHTIAAHKDLLKDYETSKGTVRFPANKPLPVTLVRKLVKIRIEENGASSAQTKTAKPAGKQRDAGPKSTALQTDPEVISFLKKLDHPLKKEIEAVRKIILGVSSEIREGIKWNAPSFCTTEYFATVHLRSLDRVQLVFHRGAKVRAGSTKGMQIADPAGLIKWLAKDRALVTVGAGKEISANKGALQAVVREWIQYL